MALQRIGVIVAASAIAVAVASCDGEDDGSAAPNETAYLTELESLCRETLTALTALPAPPELITVEDFAAEAASLLAAEAEAARRMQPPRDSGLDDDHRAFVRNTDEQAAAWNSIGSAVENDDLADVTTRIGELVLGRDELVIEMGAADCVRGGVELDSPSAPPTDPPVEGSDS